MVKSRMSFYMRDFYVPVLFVGAAALCISGLFPVKNRSRPFGPGRFHGVLDVV